jgi:hypothetical protein
MNRLTYTTWIRIDGNDFYALWSCNDEAYFVLNAEGKLPVFDSISKCMKYAELNNIRCEDQFPILHDLDAVDYWLRKPSAANIDCKSFLNFWNLTTDLRTALNALIVTQEDSTRSDIYDKVFWGSNLDVLTPPGESFNPHWSESDITDLVAVLSDGLDLFKKTMVSNK